MDKDTLVHEIELCIGNSIDSGIYQFKVKQQKLSHLGYFEYLCGIICLNSKHIMEYTSNRLCFKADLIEPLKDNDSFIVRTPNGIFKFTKAYFYRVFSNVIETKSYQERRICSF